ncbi:MAG: helix-turn-helix domain-containing protein [Myxococcales bacterium]
MNEAKQSHGTQEQEPLWTVQQAAAFLNMSKSFVYKVAEAGTLTCHRIGSRIRFSPEDVRAFARGTRREAAVIQFARVK